MELNTTQRTILFLSTIIIVLMILFPPTTFTAYNQLDGATEVFTGYQFIGELHTMDIKPVLDRGHVTNSSIFNIETTRLSFQLIGVIVATIFLVIALHNTSKTTRKNSKANTDINVIQLVGVAIVGLSVIMFAYMISVFVSQGLENSSGFITGYFIIPVTVLCIGSYVVYHSHKPKQDE